MGTSFGSVRYTGMSMDEAYKEACQDAEEEHGHEQGYSGHINATHGFVDVTRKYNAATNKRKFIDESEEKQSKGDCWGICIKKPVHNTNKIKTSVEITPQKGTRKWETRYQAENFEGRVYVSEKTQTLAIKKAREHTAKTRETLHLVITKVLVGGSTRIGRITYKQSSKEQPGEYLFLYAASS